MNEESEQTFMPFEMTQEWWKSATGYQIYPRSFADSTGDGIGDIGGILSKLEYLEALGVGFIWLSPVFKSPMCDNGYDISDYYDIAPEFGTLDDMDRLIVEAGRRNIGIVMDLVVNHSSDEHAWFENAKSSKNADLRDFYIWRDPAADGGPPNDLQSFFGGPAWTFEKATGQYYFHLFDAKQPDLNWQNKALRGEVHKMMNWWFDRGIAGFRMDVIDLIGKNPDEKITADGPDLHGFLQEMHEATLKGRNVVTVGEAWSANLGNAQLYSGAERGALSMVFQFSHISQDWDADFGKYKAKDVDFVALKKTFNAWQMTLQDDGWNSLFWSNHDLPRAVSRYGHDAKFRVESAKALGLVLHLMKGTPYIYQGEEIGMTNSTFATIDAFDDVEVHGQWPQLNARGLSEGAFLAGANQNSRDHARTPMQWSNEPHAGFSSGTPWLGVNPNFDRINVAHAQSDPSSVLVFYQKLTRLRQSEPLLIDGGFVPLFEDHPELWGYLRTGRPEKIAILVLANMSVDAVTVAVPDHLKGTGYPILCTHAPRLCVESTMVLEPYEAFALRLDGCL
jgi:oligo-1,6-glucosidase